MKIERIHRVELAAPVPVPVPARERNLARLDAAKWPMLQQWSKTKRAPEHAGWLHAKAFEAAGRP